MEMGSDEEEEDHHHHHHHHHQIRNVTDVNNNSNKQKLKKIANPNSNSKDGLVKPKRQMKTPFQLETLENVYAEETYPSEATRAELSEKLDLTDRQLQMWFCHRRLKDKKDGQAKKPAAAAAAKPPSTALSSVNKLPAAAASRSVHEPDYRSDSGSGSGGCSPYSESRRDFASRGSSSSRAELDEYETMGKAAYEPSHPPLSAMVRRAVVCIEAQLGEPLRDDGPILGVEFDPLPPGAFGTPIAMQKHQVHTYESKMYEPSHDARPRRSQAAPRSFHEQQSMDDPSSFTPEMYGRYSESHARGMDYEVTRSKSSPFMHRNGPLARSYGTHGNASRNCSTSQQDMRSPILPSTHGDSFMMERDSSVLRTEDPYLLSDGVRKSNDVHRKINDGRVGRGSDTRDNRGQKDPEKLEIHRKKNEERMRKEMERHERERRKEEERLMRERIKEEERSHREQQREIERREKFLQREYERAEKQKQKEEVRRERDAIKRKIAIEKATARRIAKESMDLIEDEQLELMDLAATSKGLPSVLQLDHDTLQNLEIYRDSLSTFPPKALQLKMPFTISPWNDSEQNVGNLLMVWRFLISFSDVLDLWPFTLDEFIQALHDYDSRLLGEVHVTLLRLIVRDIEDVAKIPITGIGNNQYTTSNPEGGHPQLVEGAYAWGFDIHSWKKHLNLVTWPEVLRQLALSAGFGPKLKKRNSRLSSNGDKDEAKGCEDIISTIRSGSAAESAFALMREKGLLAPRKSRHRLTPGTVKFAAFHVLSLEGSKGLTVLELADKIQKSGLRDLTTSKTPEASISVALTRDVKLFERIAPSTYCVRAPYAKDPADGEAILADARKKIKAFENGFIGPEDVNDLERDEDFEGDIDEDPEVDDLTTPASASKGPGLNAGNGLSGKAGDTMLCDVKTDVMTSAEKGMVCSVDNKNDLAEESYQGQSWIQGLTQGDYCHLSVEERLDALVALVGIANEGNSIRAALEDRMEAANSLKKQIWAEAQLDNSCMRGVLKLDFQNLSSSKSESTMGPQIIQSSTRVMDSSARDPSHMIDDSKPLEVVTNDLHKSTAERAFINQEANISQENSSSHQGYASKRSRSQLKSYLSHKAEEVYPYRSLPLGQDRRHNRYWHFAVSASKSEPCSGLLFVELHDGKWRLIDSEEAFDTLVASLDMRGIRESHLRLMLQKIEGSFKENACKKITLARNPHLKENSVVNHSLADFVSPSGAISGSDSDSMETSTSIRVELGSNNTEKENLSKRFHDFQRWMWNETYNSLPSCARKYGKKRCELLTTCEVCAASYLSEYTHCTSCHQRLDMVDSSEKKILDSGSTLSLLPFGVRLLKALLVFLEASIPDEALESFWTEDERKLWGLRLNALSSPEELLQILTSLESAIKKESLSSNFISAKELMEDDDDSVLVDVLPWIPKTVSAVALRLSDLDASIIYVKPEKPEIIPEDDNEHSSLFPANSLLKGRGPNEKEEQDEVVPRSSNRRNKRGRLTFGSGSNRKVKRKKAQGGPNRFVTSTRNVAVDRNLTNVELNHQVPGRGKRTVRKRPERNHEDNYRLVSRMTDIVRPKDEEVEEEDDEEEEEEEPTFRDIDEDWAGVAPREVDEDWANETPNRTMTPMQVDDENYNNVGVGSEDDDDDDNGGDDDGDGQFVDYSQRNKWGLDWKSNPNVTMEEEEEVMARFERVEREDVAEMSESSEEEEEDNNAAANNYDRDYSSSDS